MISKHQAGFAGPALLLIGTAVHPRRVVGTLLLASLIGATLAGCSAASSPSSSPSSPAAARVGSSSSTAPSAQSGGTGGGPVSEGADSAKVNCGAFASAVAQLFPGGTSAPSESAGTCLWGIGANATAKPADIAQSLQDVFSLHFTDGDDAETQYGGDVQFMGGADHAVAIAGVGTAAVYIAGDNGVPKVAAWSGRVSCGATLFLADAKTVGLTAPSGAGEVVASADVAGLAKRIADACAVGWGG